MNDGTPNNDVSRVFLVERPTKCYEVRFVGYPPGRGISFSPSLEAMHLFGSRTPRANIWRSSEGDQNVPISVEYF